MESQTYIKNIKVSPRKLRYLLAGIKKHTPADSLPFLYYMNKKAAKSFYHAIKSAITNATIALKVKEDLLQFKVLTVEEGQKLKRYKPGGRGTAKPFRHRYSHIRIVLTAKKEMISAKKPVKSALRPGSGQGKLKEKSDFSTNAQDYPELSRTDEKTSVKNSKIATKSKSSK